MKSLGHMDSQEGIATDPDKVQRTFCEAKSNAWVDKNSL